MTGDLYLRQVGPFKGSSVKNVGLFKLFIGPDSIFSHSRTKSGPRTRLLHSFTTSPRRYAITHGPQDPQQCGAATELNLIPVNYSGEQYLYPDQNE